MPETTTPQRRVVVRRYKRKGRYFTEALSTDIGLGMVQIPGGEFLMGSPADELENFEREQPHHPVTVPTFFMGRYPITQAQWRIVAGWPKVEEDLELDPANFKGDNRPVEKVSWDDAQEFCRRLAARTNRNYRLPSEAEWEYACRAGTTTPFHFGETIDATLANYRAEDYKVGDTLYKGAYGRGVEGEYREETTEVGIFPPNDFGLHDMHGNVWEWCEDDWHVTYEGAPEDGSAWVESDGPPAPGRADRSETSRVNRGGSWFFNPRYLPVCFSLLLLARLSATDLIGFRVCCDSPRTLGT